MRNQRPVTLFTFLVHNVFRLVPLSLETFQLQMVYLATIATLHIITAGIVRTILTCVLVRLND